MLERQVGHMVRLIDDLLDVSRISSGKINLQRRPTPLTDLINGAVEANRAAIETAGIELTVQLPQTPLTLDVDATRFVQVLSNLLHNAVKFTDSGGRIAINCDVVDPAGGAREVEVSVTDTGAGISSEMLPRIFELFTQGERSHRAHGGLGIGLALARRIVALLGGGIDARSDGQGRGSTFTIRMPLLEQTFEVAPAEPPPDDRRVFNRRVLIIDDNDDAAEMLAAIVRVMGGAAETADNALDGIERASTFAPDIILLDIGMAGMDGYEACRRIRQEPAGEAALIVAITGWGQERDKQRAIAAGFDAHLTKPVGPIELERLLAAASSAPIQRPWRPRNTM
jgi:CheY-like chemotaxis protein